jgi:hypothetical protein
VLLLLLLLHQFLLEHALRPGYQAASAAEAVPVTMPAGLPVLPSLPAGRQLLSCWQQPMLLLPLPLLQLHQPRLA